MSLCQSQRLSCPLLLLTPGCHCASRRGCPVHCSYLHLVSLCQSQRLSCPLLLLTPDVIVPVVEVVLSIALTYTWCHCASRRGCHVHCSYLHLVSLCQSQRLSSPLLLLTPGVIVSDVKVVLSIAPTYTWCHCASRRGCPVHCSYLHPVSLCQSERLYCPLLLLTPGVIVPVVEVVLSIALSYTWFHCASRRGCPVHCSYLHLVSLCQSQRLSCPLLLLTSGVIVPVVEAVLSIALTYTWCHCVRRGSCPVHCSYLHLVSLCQSQGCPVHCSYLHLMSLCQSQRLSCPLLLLTPGCHCASRRGCPVHCSYIHLVSLCQSQRFSYPLLLLTPDVIVPVVEVVLSIALTYTWCHCASRRGCHVHCSYLHLVSLCQSQRLSSPLLLLTPGVIVSVVKVVLSIAPTYTWCHCAGRRGCPVNCSYLHLVSLCQLQRLSCPLLLLTPGVIVPVVEVVLSIALTYTWCYCASRRGCPVHCSYLHLVSLCQSQRLSCPLLFLTPGVIVPVVEVVLSIALTYTWCHCASRRGCHVHCSYLHLVSLCQSQRLSSPLILLTPGVIVSVVEVVLSIAPTYTWVSLCQSQRLSCPLLLLTPGVIVPVVEVVLSIALAYT